MLKIRKSNIQKTFWNFVQSEQSGGIILILCAIFALIISNSLYSNQWFHFWEKEYGPEAIHLKKSVLHWVNDGFMAIFFLLVGLEIKREIVEGELSSVKKSLLPVIAALGGMIMPACIYSVINFNSMGKAGWGIPMATDIAFALGVLSLLGNRVPFSLKIMLTALAIVDDLGAILVIALFYTSQIDFNYLLLSFITMIMLFALNRFNVYNLIPYLFFGVFLWFFVLKSGIHATISGVLLALTIPLGKGRKIATLETLEHYLHKPVAFFIMPLFALANTGLIFNFNTGSLIQSSISTGVFFGLLLGKPLGIILFTWMAERFKLIRIPRNTTWMQLTGVGFLAGIGFTMSIFITLLAFENVDFQNFSKVSVLIASVTAGLTGYLILRYGYKGSNEASNLNS